MTAMLSSQKNGCLNNLNRCGTDAGFRVLLRLSVSAVSLPGNTCGNSGAQVTWLVKSSGRSTVLTQAGKSTSAG